VIWCQQSGWRRNAGLGETDLSDQIVFEPKRAGNGESQTAALVGIKKETVELLTLYLEIVGWQCIVVQSVSASTINSFQLLIIDDALFHRDMMPQIDDYRTDLPIISIGESQKANPPGPRFNYLATPLSIKDIERIIESI
jgi:hypothetical protein